MLSWKEGPELWRKSHIFIVLFYWFEFSTKSYETNVQQVYFSLEAPDFGIVVMSLLQQQFQLWDGIVVAVVVL